MRSEKFHTLFELNRLVRETIECEMPNEYWVEAELSECRELRGHCYMELIENISQVLGFEMDTRPSVFRTHYWSAACCWHEGTFEGLSPIS